MQVSGQLRAPAALMRGKDPRYTLDRGLGRPQSRSGQESRAPLGNPTPVANRNTDWNIQLCPYNTRQ
jgi:hypothetical protein